MERLNRSATFDQEFHRILEDEALDDLSAYYRKDFFDEIPLFSRAAQLAFLQDVPPNQIDCLLVGFGLDYLRRVVNHDTPSAEFLAAITFNHYSKRDDLIPNIFVCHGNVQRLRDAGLVLKEPRSVFATRVLGLLREESNAGEYRLLQDTVTIPRKARVFIGPCRFPHPRMVGLDVLSPSRTPANGRATRV